MEYNKYQHTVTIACPVRDREDYLPYYLQAILKQTYPRNLTNLFFVANNVTDNSIKILKTFKQQHSQNYPLIRIAELNNEKIPYDGSNRMVRTKNQDVYNFLATLRNYICKNVSTDYLFSCDSDIMIKPDTLEKLINWGKNCISALVCNGHTFAKLQPHKRIDKYKFTNILKKGLYGRYIHFRKSELNGLLEVDVTGAVYLIKKHIYKHCRYKPDLQGEDIPFCEDVRKMNEKIYCDADLKLPHCMDLGLLELYKKGKFEY